MKARPLWFEKSASKPAAFKRNGTGVGKVTKPVALTSKRGALSPGQPHSKSYGR
jgi:hypothetical protein